jgi:iron complex outermembrane receptor protein
MMLKHTFGCAAWVIAVALTNVAHAEAPADDAATSAAQNQAMQAQDIVVTARRSVEKLQDVPVAVSVLSQASIDTHGVFNPIDLAITTPGLEVAANIADRNSLIYNIRGQGNTYGTLFPAVITYFNEVPVAHLTQGVFFDLANVQVLRGPQGVQFGRVTDGGNVMLQAQEPKNEFGGYLEAKIGDYSLRSFSGALNIPIVADKVLLRLSFESDRRGGFTYNLYDGKDLDNVHSDAYRGVLTLKPVDGLKNVTTVAYQHTNDNGTSVIYDGQNPAAAGTIFGAFTVIPGYPTSGPLAALLPLYGLDTQGNVIYKFTGAPGVSPLIPGAAGLTPLTAASYLASLNSQLAAQQARGVRTVDIASPLFDRRTNVYVTNVTTADLTSDIQLKNVFGYVREKDDEAQVYIPANGGLVEPCHSACPTASPGIPWSNQEQFSDEVRLAGKSFDHHLTWSLGAYFDEQRPAGLAQNQSLSLGVTQRDSVAIVTTKSRAFYGYAEYAVTDAWKINAGIRNTHDTVNSQTENYQFPTFVAVPSGLCETFTFGGVTDTCTTVSQAFNFTSWTAGTSYKVDTNKLLYAKISTGYRPGGVNASVPPGVSPAYNQENDTSVEVGVKADWNINGVFARTNIAAYHDRYKSIQKNISVVGSGGTLYAEIENVAAATVQGVEFEGQLIPVKGLKLGATAAYTDAKFDANHGTGPTDGQTLAEVLTNPTSPCSTVTHADIGFCTDNLFSYTPKFQWSLSADYTTDLGDKIGAFSIGATLYHQSSIALNDSSTENPDVIERGYSLVNLNAGLKNAFGQPFDLGFFVTNLTNKTYRIGADSVTEASSLGASGSIYAPPRMYGFSLKIRFGGDAK